MIKHLFHGLCMALADSVPGVSGGTIAFILGFYDNFIGSLDDLISGNLDKKKKALSYLIKLGIGWIIGFICAVSILVSIFEERIYEISSLFIGFIVFAIPLVYFEEKKDLHTDLKSFIAMIVGIVFVIVIANCTNALVSDIDLTNLGILDMLYIFIVAAIAICAMVLPGISGSTLLLIFGLYLPIISAVKALITLQFQYLPALIIFGLGIICGITSIVKVIRWALEKHRSIMIYLIIGLMIGSIYAIILGPTTLDIPKEAMTLSTFSIIFFLIGGAVILGLQALKNKK